jgi:lipopolysaccharide transport system ATP-binding protein
LTGRENIYINGSVLGLTKKEIDAKIDEIIDFAEIREAIDTPVQNYSSGMNVRLGFAVATAMNPDVIILDEVLAVGDVNFRAKCFNRISSMISSTSCILVSHTESDIRRICTKVMLLDKGSQKTDKTDVDNAYKLYYEIAESSKKTNPTILDQYSDSKLFIRDFKFPEKVHWGSSLEFNILLDCRGETFHGGIRISFMTAAEDCVGEWSTIDNIITLIEITGKKNYSFSIKRINLCKGFYHANVIIFSESSPYKALKYKAAYFEVEGPAKLFSEYRME